LERVKKLLVYLILIAVAYYFVPAIPKIVPSLTNSSSAVFLLFLATPLICFVVSLIRGMISGMDILYIVLTYVVYIPMILIYKNMPIIIYGIIYTLFCGLGIYVGSVVKKFRE
jgi:hypothetical protein